MTAKTFWNILIFLLVSSNAGTLSKGDAYPLAEGPLLSKAISLVNRHYVDSARIDPDAMFEASLNQIQKTIPEVLARCEKPAFCSVTVQKAVRRFSFPGGDLKMLRSRLKDVFQFMELHVDEDTQLKDIEYAAIDGLLEELDPHSNFMSPEAFREFQVGTEGEFGGLGIVINIKDGHLTVMSPLEGTPAWKAGVKPQDRIVQIDEESTINMSLTEAVDRLRGPVGSKVTIKIERTGAKTPLTYTLMRDIINIEAVQSLLVKTPAGNPVGFVRIKSFQGNTERDFYDQIKKLTRKENRLKGIVLDLRNNPGGLLDQSIALADAILKEGTIVSTVGRQGRMIEQNTARNDGYEGDWPIIVLVNEGSASASEILAGALKNNHRALVVGHKTFGKGSVQSVYNLPLGAALKLTVAQYLTPGNQSIQSVGITPDIELFPVIVDKDHLDTAENIFRSEKDLEKHFDGNGVRAEQPAFKLAYMAPPPEKEEAGEYSTKLELKEDVAADVALSLMDAITHPHRQAMLEEALATLKAKEKAEDLKITEAFRKLGVNWKTAPAEGQPQGELNFQLLENGKTIERAKAGKTLNLQLTFRNVGQVPFYRLVGQTTAEEFLFQNIEFAFGEVAPGQTRKWQTKLEIPKGILTEDIVMKLKFTEANNHIPPEVKLILPLEGLKQPLFTHQYSLEDNWSGKLKKGKAVAMTLNVTNKGEGTSEKPVAALKNLGGKEIFIEKGRVALKALEPGKTQEAQFLFHMDPAWEGESPRFELTIVDADMIVGSKQNITLKINQGEVEPPQATAYNPPVIHLAARQGKVSAGTYVLQGEASDDQTVRDLFIFLDEKKAFYEANAKGGQKFSFKAPLNLQEGNNLIAVTARDNFNLISRQFLSVYYEPQPAKSR